MPDTPEAQAALVNRYMEQMIRRFPEQYLWSYNRYKVPRGATPPAAAASGKSAHAEASERSHPGVDKADHAERIAARDHERARG